MGKLVPASETVLAQLDEISRDVTEGFNPQVVVMKILHGQEEFTLPGLRPQPRLEGVILASKRVRLFFPRLGDKKEAEAVLTFTSKRPVCSSSSYTDGVLAEADWDNAPEVANMLREKIAEGALKCAACPLNEWGSVELLGQSGRGKACQDIRRLLYFQQGTTIPIIIGVSSTSVRNWDQYCSSLEAGQLRHNRVVTELSLEHRQFVDQHWSVLNFRMVSPLTEPIALELIQPVVFGGEEKPLVRALIDLFLGRDVTIEELPDNGGGKEAAAEEDF